MAEDISIVLASNRGPVSFVKHDDGFETTRGAGGMAGALDPVARRLGDKALWIAAATSETDREALAAGAGDSLGEELGYPMYLLTIEPDVYSRFYDVVSNRLLWFANHCLWDELRIKDFGKEELDAFENAYKPVNERFANAVLEVSEESSIVLFQDYHLTLAPGMLRQARPEQTIFHFTHSSFCGPDGLERIPEPIPRQVVEGMLGADLLGFHVKPWVHGFLDSCASIGARVDRERGLVERDGRPTWVREYPIPVAADELRQRARGEAAQRWAKRLRGEIEGPIIVRADRTEPSKNIVRGFEAFGVLLDRRPDLRNHARFVACLYESRQSMPEYRRYIDEIRSMVDAVNARHPGSIDLFLEDDYDRTLGALTVYDVLLINPIMDGMNLVSKEGPAVNERDGAVVLSELAGSFEELGDQAVVIHDPHDIEETAAALEQALELPSEERRGRAETLRKIVTRSRPEDWIEPQLDDLQAIQSGNEPLTPPC